MTLLHEAVETKKFDTRMTERNLARSVISADELEKHLKKLPDDGANADYTSLDSLTDDESVDSEA